MPAWRATEHAEVRVIIEKPFGTSLAEARDLNAKVLSVFEEGQVFRIDHYLGKETVQNMLAFRFANGMFEPLWNRNYIDERADHRRRGHRHRQRAPATTTTPARCATSSRTTCCSC